MTTPNPPGGSQASASGGTLLGTNALQGVIDKFSNAVNKLDTFVGSLANTPTGLARNSGGNGSSAQQQPAYGSFPSMQNPFSAMIKPVYGPNAQGQMQPTGAYKFTYAGQQQPGQSYPNGGGSAPGGGGGAFGLPTTLGGAASSVYGAVKGFGSSMLPVQAAMSNYVQMGTLAAPNGMSNLTASNILRGMAFGNGSSTMNAIANNPADAMQGQALINWASGGFAGANPMGMAMQGAANMFGYANQGLGYTGSASLAQSLYSPQMSMRMLQMGYPVTPRAMGGGRPTAAPAVMQGMMSTWYQGRRSVSQNVLNAGLAPGGNVYNNLVYGMGLSGQNLTTMEGTLQAYNKLANAGYSNNTINSLFAGARNDNQGAINKLSAAGITQSDLQVLKNRTASQTGNASNEMQGFTAGLRDSVGLLTQFNKILSAITGRSPIGGALGYGGGIGAGGALANVGGAGGIGGFISGAIGMGLSATKLFGGAASPSRGSTSQSSPAKSATSLGGISNAAKAAVGAAERELGVPYVWGGESPGKGFDCSGLTQWAYSQAGVKLPRTAAQQWAATQNRSVPLNAVQEGDLVFSAGEGDGGTFASPGHVGLMVSSNRLIEAPFTGEDVKIIPYSPSDWQHASRPSGSMSTGTGSAANGGANSTSSAAGGMGSLGGGLSSTSEADNISAALGGGSSGMGGAIGGTTAATNGTSTGSTGSSTAGGSGSGSAPTNSVAALAKQMAAKRGWTGQLWNDLNNVEMREAGWRMTARNPSGAYGIAQFIDGPSEYYKYGGNPNTPLGQVTAFENYVQDRYHGPAGAWQHEQQFNWYGAGTRSSRRGPMVVGDRGPEVLWSGGGDTVMPLGQASSLLLSGRSGGASINLNFGKGAIQISGVGGSDVSNSAQEFVRQVKKALDQDVRIKQIAAGAS